VATLLLKTQKKEQVSRRHARLIFQVIILKQEKKKFLANALDLETLQLKHKRISF